MGEIFWIAGSYNGATEHLESALEADPGDLALAARLYPRLIYFNVAHNPVRAVDSQTRRLRP